jgi:hypothetical protein
MPELARVTGKVTLDGEPLSGAVVTFESSDGQVAFGSTNESGQYELRFRSGISGAPVGQNTVRIESALDAPPPEDYRDPIPARYNTESTLQENVQSGENVIDFDLSSN